MRDHTHTELCAAAVKLMDSIGIPSTNTDILVYGKLRIPQLRYHHKVTEDERQRINEHVQLSRSHIRDVNGIGTTVVDMGEKKIEVQVFVDHWFAPKPVCQACGREKI